MKRKQFSAFQTALVEDDNLTGAGVCIDRRWRSGKSGMERCDRIRKSHRMSAPAILISAPVPPIGRSARDRVLRHLTGEANQIVPAGVIVAATICLLHLFGHRLA